MKQLSKKQKKRLLAAMMTTTMLCNSALPTVTAFANEQEPSEQTKQAGESNDDSQQDTSQSDNSDKKFEQEKTAPNQTKETTTQASQTEETQESTQAPTKETTTKQSSATEETAFVKASGYAENGVNYLVEYNESTRNAEITLASGPGGNIMNGKVATALKALEITNPEIELRNVNKLTINNLYEVENGTEGTISGLKQLTNLKQLLR